MVGNTLLPGSDPYAQRYGGHQFGSWAGQLGDGRAISLGEVETRGGARWELQLKGAGPTPYSRSADGRAVLRSSLREFLASEAMAGLGVPTTRALSVAATGDVVPRDIFYNGRVAPERSAVVCRVAPSFLRFGSFELLARCGEGALLRRLLRYCVRHHFPHLLPLLLLRGDGSGGDSGDSGGDSGGGGGSDEEWTDAQYAAVTEAFLREVTAATARLAAHWQSLGFIHGVLNTDNMSVHALTLDYGPFAFVEAFHAHTVANLSDDPRYGGGAGRYSLQNQPSAMMWNCSALTIALGELVPGIDSHQLVLDEFSAAFHSHYNHLMCRKLGLLHWRGEEDTDLLSSFLALLQTHRMDFTRSFRALCDVQLRGTADTEEHVARLPTDTLLQPLRSVIRQREPAAEGGRGGSGGGGGIHIPVIEVSEATVEREWAQWMRRYMLRLLADGVDDEVRADGMCAVNPRYILRNHLAHTAIQEAEESMDLSECRALLRCLSRPFEEQPEMERRGYAAPRPEWARRPGVAALT